LKQRIRNTKPYITAKGFLSGLHLRNTPATVYHVLKILWDKLIKFDIDERAAAVAYNFMLAIFPTIIFLFSVIPYIPVPHLDVRIMALLKTAMPASLYKEAASTIFEIVKRPRGGILSFGFIFAIYASTSGMMALMRAFNQTYRTAEKRSFIKARLIAIMLNFLLTFVLFVAVVVLIIGRILVDILFEQEILSRNITFYSLQGLTYLVVFGVFFTTISIIYYYAPAIHKRWSFFNVGSITASVLTIMISNLFSYYLSNFASYNRLYGSIGTIIALMVWLYLIALILILGFEINASIDQAMIISEEHIEEENGVNKLQ
jgi:membrane protein